MPAGLTPLTISVLALGTAVGVAAGVGGYTFVYAKGSAYLTDDPEACNNCHVMNDQFDSWIKSSHRNVATCNDCHTPAGFPAKYVAKALNGYHHSTAFTLGDFHEPIRMGERNRKVTEAACRRCHGDMVDAIDGPHREGDERTACLRCHESVGHLHLNR